MTAETTQNAHTIETAMAGWMKERELANDISRLASRLESDLDAALDAKREMQEAVVQWAGSGGYWIGPTYQHVDYQEACERLIDIASNPPDGHSHKARAERAEAALMDIHCATMAVVESEAAIDFFDCVDKVSRIVAKAFDYRFSEAALADAPTPEEKP